MEEVLKYVIPSLSPAVLLLLALLLAPEKIEKWSALLWKLLSKLGGLFRSAHKRYVKHDLQGRINDFVRGLRKQLPGITATRFKIEWIDPTVDRKAFVDRGELVMRLRRDDPHDHNFVHGSYLFVSEMLLKKAKRYISRSQKEALDLFVCSKLLESEKPAVVTFFLDEYLHPGTETPKSKVALYVDDFAIIDKGGLFFPVLAQELEFLGEKVFGRRRDDQIVKEVDGLVHFLKPIATRTVGDHSDLDHDGSYCRFAIVIVGKPSKLLTSIEPYVGFIRGSLKPKQTETIYLLGRAENERRLQEICERVSDTYDCCHRVKFSSFLRYSDRKELALQHLTVLRLKGTPMVRASA